MKTRLLLNAGEWYLDSTQGMPWLTAVMGKYTQRGCDSVIKAYILDTPGVDSILSYSSVLNHTTRALSVTVTLSTIYGAATVAAVVAF